MEDFREASLAIPHFVVLYFLGISSGIITVIAGVAILFTGSYPKGLFDFQLLILRWSANVTAYVELQRDEYPPFGEAPFPARMTSGLSRSSLALEDFREMAPGHSIGICLEFCRDGCGACRHRRVVHHPGDRKNAARYFRFHHWNKSMGLSDNGVHEPDDRPLSTVQFEIGEP